MTKRLFLVVAAAFCFAATTTVWAHPGRLDRYGCHQDRKAGDYHCHRGPLAGQHFPSKAEMLKRLNSTPAQLACNSTVPANYVFPPGVGAITVTKARIGCLDIQIDGNLTGLVGGACNGKACCTYKAPTEDEYTRAGVTANRRTFCTQAMEITYHCGDNDDQIVTVPGDAWNQPPAQLICDGGLCRSAHAGWIRALSVVRHEADQQTASCSQRADE